MGTLTMLMANVWLSTIFTQELSQSRLHYFAKSYAAEAFLFYGIEMAKKNYEALTKNLKPAQCLFSSLPFHIENKQCTASIDFMPAADAVTISATLDCCNQQQRISCSVQKKEEGKDFILRNWKIE